MDMRTELTDKTEILLPSIFATACLLFTVFFPFATVLETVIGTAAFSVLLPVLFVRIILKEKAANPLRFFSWRWNRELIIWTGSLLGAGSVLGFLFSKMSVIELYQADLASVGMTTFGSILLLNTLFFVPFLVIFSYFGLGFVPYILTRFSATLGIVVGAVVFVGLMNPVYGFPYPNVPYWFLLPVALPLLGASVFRKHGMLWIVPALASVINIVYALFVS